MVYGSILTRVATAIVPRVEAFVARATPIVTASVVRAAPVVGRVASSVGTAIVKHPLTSFVGYSIAKESIKTNDYSAVPNILSGVDKASTATGQVSIQALKGNFSSAIDTAVSYVQDNPVQASLIGGAAVLYSSAKFAPAILNYMAINNAGKNLTSNYDDQGAIALSLAQQEQARLRQAAADANALTEKYKGALLGNDKGPEPSKTTGADGPLPEKDNSTGNAGGVITPQTGPIGAAGGKSLTTRKYRKQPISSSTHNFRINIINANQSRLTTKRYISGY